MASRKYGTTTLPQILALRDQGLNWLEVADRLNVRPDALRALASVLGIKGAMTAAVASYPVKQWVQRLARGDTAQDIAQSHGIPRRRVYSVLRARGLPTTCREAIKARHAPLLPAAKTAGATPERRSVGAKNRAHRAAAHAGA